MTNAPRSTAAALLAMGVLTGTALQPANAATTAAATAATIAAPNTLDLMERPAPLTAHGVRRLLLDVAPGGPGFVAVGEMGQLLASSDGKTWQQQTSPTSVMLTAVYFPERTKGWAVGHDGVILATTDGGRRWERQFDGRRANAAVLAVAQQEVADAEAATPRNEERIAQAQDQLASAQDASKAGPSRPLLAVRFVDTLRGFAAGAFGQLFATDNGGADWRYIGNRLPNPEGLHLNGLSSYGEALYLAAEQGVVFVSTNQGKSWQRSETGYAGNLYGVLPMAGADGNQILLAYGFKGHLFRSLDQGAHWSALPRESSRKTWVQAQAQEGTAWLLTEDGRLFTSRDRGETLTPFGTSPLAIRRFAGFTLQGNRLVAVGLGGASLHVLDNRP